MVLKDEDIVRFNGFIFLILLGFHRLEEDFTDYIFLDYTDYGMITPIVRLGVDDKPDRSGNRVGGGWLLERIAELVVAMKF